MDSSGETLISEELKRERFKLMEQFLAANRYGDLGVDRSSPLESIGAAHCRLPFPAGYKSEVGDARNN